MYIPSSFAEGRIKNLHDLIRKNSFGILTSQKDGHIEATHLPFMIEPDRGEHGSLITHMARANKHWRSMDDKTKALVIFQGPHSYISPSWYESKVTVPTWNYAAVHVYGKPSLVRDVKHLRKIVTELVHFHEPPGENGWDIKKAEPKMDSMLKAIVGIEIPIECIEGKMKFNQNRSEEDRRGVIKNLLASNDSAGQKVAEIIKKQLDGQQE